MLHPVALTSPIRRGPPFHRGPHTKGTWRTARPASASRPTRGIGGLTTGGRWPFGGPSARGWVGALTVTALGTLFGLFQLIAFASAGLLIGTLIGVTIGVLVIWYLTRPGVRALFAHKSKI